MYTSLNIAFRPPQEIIDEAVRVSQKLAQENEAHFILDNVHFFPHLTIYSADFPEKNIVAIQNKLGEILKGEKAIQFIFTGIDPVLGWIGVNVEYTEPIREIHEKILYAINPLRDGHVTEKKLNALNEDLPPSQKENIRQFGRPLVLADYKPHLTFTRLKDEQKAVDVARNMVWTSRSFVCNEVALFKGGEQGTCVELLKSYSLK